VVARFRGDIEQIPPMYSALKRDGRPLYEYARAGVEVDRAPRRVVIRSLAWRDFADDEFTIDVRCTKGTYVRALAEDIGAALGCGAHLVALRRTAIGPFRVDDALTLDVFGALPQEDRRAALRPIDALIAGLPEVRIAATHAEAFRQGQVVPGAARTGASVRVYADGGFLGVGEGLPDGRLQPRRVVVPAIEADR